MASVSPQGAARKLTPLARLGFVARGIVYILVGWFAIDAARSGRRPIDNQAALGSLDDTSAGSALLLLMAAGLLGYALWRLAEAWYDPEGRGVSFKGGLERAGFALSGLAHVALAYYAVRLALRPGGGGGGSAPGDANARDWSAWLLEQPAGPLLVGAVGAVFVLAALAQAHKAYTGHFLRHLEGNVPAPRQIRLIGGIGYGARAIAFSLVGWFFLRAGLQSDAAEAGGLGQALRHLQGQEHGPALLAVVAAGFILFGLFSLVEGRYRRIAVPHG